MMAEARERENRPSERGSEKEEEKEGREREWAEGAAAAAADNNSILGVIKLQAIRSGFFFPFVFPFFFRRTLIGCRHQISWRPGKEKKEKILFLVTESIWW